MKGGGGSNNRKKLLFLIHEVAPKSFGRDYCFVFMSMIIFLVSQKKNREFNSVSISSAMNAGIALLKTFRTCSVRRLKEVRSFVHIFYFFFSCNVFESILMGN